MKTHPKLVLLRHTYTCKTSVKLEQKNEKFNLWKARNVFVHSVSYL